MEKLIITFNDKKTTIRKKKVISKLSKWVVEIFFIHRTIKKSKQ